ncbi:leucine-rich repeat-containing serine/threonine-protein kinase [Hymenobacter sp. NST-14]|uniref:leucine-rich repeat-containing protein kinase family protein n=1 Tax=Hymenobacter piscis TaxID=2839984 RepID=UPI001C02188B|nr:leucine-rich repeat-containing protein kinase family protein [Hymenobacter piscis]MBT9394657.1 leucine-rich repeat-containing serine/threonine-protein kinase [Hymenobacter piscis]
MHTLAQLRAGALAGATRLDLAEGLTEFPREIFELSDTLEILNLSGNALRELPADLPRLHRLRIFFGSDNEFTQVPAVLGQCPNLEMVGFKANHIRELPGAALPPRLRWLILTDNELAALPPEIGNCGQLQKLMLAGNRLRELPPELARCTHLELLRLAANQLTTLPEWLLTMPRLSWLAFAGNPLATAAEAAALARADQPAIAWRHLSTGPVLGEGASGIIYRGEWQRAAGVAPEPVAVKLFKGAVTSDGLPHSEMVACRSAGAHPHLIAVRGTLPDHPTGREGLVLELIDPAFTTLAGPPSFATCTRDVYAPAATFELPVLLRLAGGIAAAVAHLHARGILHGDLYGHNILTTPAGESLLGDFGAAGFLPDSDDVAAQLLPRLETRAFGNLLEELLDRCPPQEEPAAGLQEELRQLQARCQQPTVAARPTLAEVSCRLRELAAVSAG